MIAKNSSGHLLTRKQGVHTLPLGLTGDEHSGMAEQKDRHGGRRDDHVAEAWHGHLRQQPASGQTVALPASTSRFGWRVR
ncbi:hypothetical protein [Streptomyces lavenduligriseus]|uniref:Uncharacterized protein n=1 Tax=Streptomyces lavenduligriseus TaxID=67315 RepID=A0ABT0P039_9ACTN|nr:hypothetical protein [Streptomyces lavenduligriseus]MCL3997085.1 hypothetical protein [Streptomyces lavenduligriseus]